MDVADADGRGTILHLGYYPFTLSRFEELCEGCGEVGQFVASARREPLRMVREMDP